MPTVVHWEVKDLPQLQVVGKGMRVQFRAVQGPENPLPEFWDQCFADGTMSTLDAMTDHHLDSSYVGWMGEWDDESQEFLYIVGMLLDADAPVPRGFDLRVIEPCQVFISWVHGPESRIFSSAHTLSAKMLNEQGYVYDETAGWSMELYNCPRFTDPDANGELILDYYLPCRRADS